MTDTNTDKAGEATAATFSQGTTTPFTKAAADSAARRMREQQRALRDTLSSSAKTVKEREEEKKKKKQQEEKERQERAKVAAKAAEEEATKKRFEERTGKKWEDATVDDILAMEMDSDDSDVEMVGEGGRNVDREDLNEVTRNLGTEGDDTTKSPVKKRQNIEVSKVTPGGTEGSALRMSSFIPHTYHHKRIILDASVRLGAAHDKDRFAEFLGQIKALLMNAKIVDKYFVINPVIMGDGKKDLRDLKDIPSNMTTLGGYVKISQKCMRAFETKPTFGANAKKAEGNDYSDTVFFTVAISCDTEPTELISRISVEWMRAGGIGIYIKEINSFNTDSAFVILLLSIFVNANIVTEELKKLLEIGVTLLAEGMGDDEIPITSVPPFALRKNLPKLPGVDVATEYRGLSNRQKQTRRAWHVEMEVHHIQTFERLVEVCKDYGVFGFWGDHVLISRVVDFDSPSGDIDRMRDFAMRHTRYQCSMMVSQLYGIVNLDAPVKLGNDESAELTLRQILPKYLRTKDGKAPLIAEVHQMRVNGPVEAVVPKAKVAEVVVSAMNRQMAAYLKFYLVQCGLGVDLVTRLLVASCCPTLVSEINQFEWDEEKQELLSIKEAEDVSKLALFEKADWYFDLAKISVSPQKKKSMEYTAPEALFNWDETQSVNTLHAKNDARRAKARNQAFGDSDSEEGEEEGSEPDKHEFGKSPEDTDNGNAGEDGNKSVTFSPAGSSAERHAGNSAAGGG